MGWAGLWIRDVASALNLEMMLAFALRSAPQRALSWQSAHGVRFSAAPQIGAPTPFDRMVKKNWGKRSLKTKAKDAMGAGFPNRAESAAVGRRRPLGLWPADGS